MPESAQKSRQELIEQDIADLRKLGYAQQLFREMGGFSNFAISFSIISILTGAILLFGFGLRFAGPIVNSIVWPLVSLFVLIIAASMAELASAYPTAGGLYFWAYRLGGVRWAWTTAWFNMIGQVTTTAGVNIGVAIYLVGAVTRMLNLPAETSIPVFGTLTNWYFYVFVMVLVTIPQALINILGIRLTARLSDFSVWWHIGGVALIAMALTFFGRTHHPLSFAFQFVTTTNPYDFSSAEISKGVVAPALYLGNPITLKPLLVLPSPLFALFPGLTALYKAAPLFLVLGIALLQAQWTYTGYDASAHMAEETYLARKNSAWGVFLSVAVSAVAGYIMLMVLTLSINDIGGTATDAYPVLKILYDNLSRFFANAIAIVIAGAMWLCGLSCITSMSRMWFAFARDGGMPGHTLIKQIHPQWRTPVYSILITCALAVIMLLWAGAYYVVTAICVIMLYWAYGIPIFLNLRNKLRRKGEFTTEQSAPWNLKRWGVPLNLISVVWIAVITVFLIIPPNELVLWTAVLVCLFMFVYWQIDVKKRFTGPAAIPSTDGALGLSGTMGQSSGS
ncbi:MAG TPA: amino acid permease [Candidatus Limnocylindrales bacterium]|jgi:amino acid transporter|nr:amino acid permease [Candidatus Limnocylindrales bacterium]